MNKEEFLIQLRECLEGQIPDDELVDALAYYRSYFQEEENSGKTEEEVIRFLGNPRLIAHSILDAHEEAVTGQSSGYHDVEEDVYEDGYDERSHTPMQEKMGDLVVKLRTILGIVLVIAVVAGLLHIFLPVIIVMIVFLVIYRFLQP